MTAKRTRQFVGGGTTTDAFAVGSNQLLAEHCTNLVVQRDALLAACEKLAEWDRPRDEATGARLISEAASMARAAITLVKGESDGKP